MARYFRFWAISCWLLAIGTFFSCQEGGDAGDLFGMWRMTGSDTNYISFSGSITCFNNPEKNFVFGNFQHESDSLFIQLYSKDGLKSDTTMIEESFGFRPFHDIRLRIETLNNDRLVLTQDAQKWSFYKY